MAGAALIQLGGSAAASTLRATLNRSIVSGFGYYPGSAQTTQSVKCTASGGTPPYTYAWTPVGVSDIDPTAPSSQTTYFSLYGLAEDSQGETFICTVTDSVAAVDASDGVAVTLTLIGTS